MYSYDALRRLHALHYGGCEGNAEKVRSVEVLVCCSGEAELLHVCVLLNAPCVREPLTLKMLPCHEP